MRTRTGGAAIGLAIGLVLAVIATVTGITPPPPNPFADETPTVLNRSGDGDLVDGIGVIEPSRSTPKLRVRTTAGNRTRALVLQDGNGTLLDRERGIPAGQHADLEILPPDTAEIYWRPTNPYTLTVTDQDSDTIEILTLQIPYAAK